MRLASSMRPCRHTAAVVLCLLWAPQAWSAACCVGTTSTIPTRVGECESGTIGIALAGEFSTGRWDRSGALATNTLADNGATATVGGGLRLGDHWQLGAAVPVRVNQRVGDEEQVWGGGLGDAEASVLWHPIDESPGRGRPPVPIFTLGVRTPTGRAWQESQRTLAEDVTGRGEVSVTLGAGLERTTQNWPWTLTIASSVATSVHDRTIRPELAVNAGIGRYLGTRWSLYGALSYIVSWSTESTHRTATAVRIVRGQALAWRGWLQVQSDLPIPELGRSNIRHVSTSAGAVWVF